MKDRIFGSSFGKVSETAAVGPCGVDWTFPGRQINNEFQADEWICAKAVA